MSIEMVFNKLTAGRNMGIPGVGGVKHLLANLEYAAYLKGISGEPLWMLWVVHFDDGAYKKRLIDVLAVDCELYLAIRDQQFPDADYRSLASEFLYHHTKDHRCNPCGGNGQLKFEGVMQQCPACVGFGRRPMFDKSMCKHLGISDTTLRNKNRLATRGIIRRMRDKVLSDMATWEGDAMRQIAINLARDAA